MRMRLPRLHTSRTQEGQRDGQNAFHYASQLQQPPGSAIYFAVDYDASHTDVAGAITDYFNGVVQGISQAAGGGLSYRIGVYGSGLVCGSIKSNVPELALAWLAESTGWSGSSSYDNWDVKQSIPTARICDLAPDEYEDCEAQGDFGAFQTPDAR